MGFKTLTLSDYTEFKVYENKVLTKIYGDRQDEGSGDVVQRYNEELYNRLGIVQSLKSRRFRWAERVARYLFRVSMRPIKIRNSGSYEPRYMGLENVHRNVKAPFVQDLRER